MLFRRLAFAFSLLFGIIASQLPEFAQQYRQRLGGAIDELDRIVAQFDTDASMDGMTREAAIARLKRDADAFVEKRGTEMSDTLVRLQRLIRQRDGFADAGPFSRLVVFVNDFDVGIARNAYRDFEPAVPTTGEGLVAGALGFVAAGGLVRALAWPFRRRRGGRATTPV